MSNEENMVPEDLVETPETDEINACDLLDDDIEEKSESREKGATSFTIDPVKLLDIPVDMTKIALPSHYDKESFGPITTALNVNIKDNQETKYWAATLTAGSGKNTIEEAFVDSQKERKFTQRVEHNGTEIHSGPAKFKMPNNAILSGDRAVLRATRFMGGGGGFDTRLWHSGFVVSIDPPTDMELLELYRILNRDKITLGRFTHGSVFSNTSVYTVKRMVEFAIAHIGSSTVRAEEGTPDFLDLIVDADYMALIWGLICTIYVNGFEFRRACIASPKTCKHTSMHHLNPTELQLTDSDMLTPAMKQQMSLRKSKSITVENVKKYQEDIRTKKSATVVLTYGQSGDSVKVTLTRPNLAGYIDKGTRWIDDIVESIDGSLAVPNGDDERNKWIDEAASATNLRQYSHYVSSITFEEGSVVEDIDAIYELLGIFSADEDMSNDLLEGVKKFINDTTVSFIGIPNHECPACGKPQGLPDKHVLPLDLVEKFFSILGTRVNQIKRK